MNTTVKSLTDDATHLAHEAATSAMQGVRNTQHLAQQGMDGLGEARAQTGVALQQLAHEANVLSHRGMDALRDGSQQLREKTSNARHATADYIQHEPIKSVLVAAAVGAGLMGLLALFSRQKGSGH